MALLLELKVQEFPGHVLAALSRLLPALLLRLVPALLAGLVPALLPRLIPALLFGLVPALLLRHRGRLGHQDGGAVLLGCLGALLLLHCDALLPRFEVYDSVKHRAAGLVEDGVALLVEGGGGEGLLDGVTHGPGLVPALLGDNGLAGRWRNAGQGRPDQGTAHEEQQSLSKQRVIRITDTFCQVN